MEEGGALEMGAGGQRGTAQEKGTSFTQHLLRVPLSTSGCTLAAHRANSGHKHGSFDPPCVLKKLEFISNTDK